MLDADCLLLIKCYGAWFPTSDILVHAEVPSAGERFKEGHSLCKVLLFPQESYHVWPISPVYVPKWRLRKNSAKGAPAGKFLWHIKHMGIVTLWPPVPTHGFIPSLTSLLPGWICVQWVQSPDGHDKYLPVYLGCGCI